MAIPATTITDAQQGLEEPLPKDYPKHLIEQPELVSTPQANERSIQSTSRMPGSNSEATREIPRLSGGGVEDQLQLGGSAIRVSIAADTIGTKRPTRIETTLAEQSANASAPDIKGADQGSPVALSEREQRLLSAEGEGQLADLKKFLEEWEFKRAFEAAMVAGNWITSNEAYIAPALASQIYETLARVETVKVQQNQEHGEKADLTRARHYLRKAKDASGR